MRNGVADVRLARAARMNALDEAMVHALVETGAELQNRKGLRAVVLSGEGRAFCSGLDTARFKAQLHESGPEDRSGDSRGGDPAGGLIDTPRDAAGANLVQRAVLVWRRLAVPVIAAIHGVAFGGGLQLALGAALRFVAADARLSAMEIQWGIVPDMAGIPLLRTLLRDDLCRDLIYSGRIVSGEEAVRIGLASRLCADPLAEALDYAAEIASKNPQAVRAAKRLLDPPATADPAMLLAESTEQKALLGSPNQIEAVRANLERRPPLFRD